jgi:hypothetical protein
MPQRDIVLEAGIKQTNAKQRKKEKFGSDRASLAQSAAA